MTAEWLSIGEFSELSRLSPKALRLYDQLGLLVPARVDASNGYRWYAPSQLDRARVVELQRHLEMPLSRITAVLRLSGRPAAEAVTAYWEEVEGEITQRRAIAGYLRRSMEGGTTAEDPVTGARFAVQLRAVPERALLSAVRHAHAQQLGVTLGALLGRMRQAGPGPSGLDGAPFLVYFGAVSADSDGPVELARPMVCLPTAQRAADGLGDVQARRDPAHDEAFVRVTKAQIGWPAVLPVLDAIGAETERLGRTVTGPPRQVMIADWRTATADTPICDIALPLAVLTS